jgi:hypothetical protein
VDGDAAIGGSRHVGGGGIHIPYRRSKLTQLLKDCFTLQRARTVVIATVSPAAKDTEHSCNTLQHASLMKGGDAASSGITVTKTPIEAAPEVLFLVGLALLIITILVL